ncbi:lysylphosphatidylglycerol synthase transmembrane domain-containing protein [Streptomyces sp. NPDC088354]|uniref:lysylphosphatidylglycerol synthase transmembrane domain-containing protein n=1 Tax=Streptomyces sp. NPDC088354 TaxID=3365856 RepID=UPI0037F9EEA5
MTVLKRAWPWLRLLLGAGILGALVSRLGTSAFLDGLHMVSGTSVLAALGIGLLTTVLSAWRWCIVARRLGLRLRIGRAVADYYRALLLNAVLPAGVLGDVHRAVQHGRTEGDVARGVRAVVLERTGGQIVVLALGVAVLLSRPALLADMTRALLPDGTGALALTAAVLGTLAVAAPLTAWELRRRRRTGKAAAALAGSLADLRRGLLARSTWPGVVLLSAAGLVGHVALFVVAARAAGSTAPVAQLVPPLTLALLVMGLPINIGGWGPREAVSTLAFGAAGLGAAQGLSTAVVYGVLTLVASLPGVAVLVLSRPPRPATAPSRRPFTARIRGVRRDRALHRPVAVAVAPKS